MTVLSIGLKGEYSFVVRSEHLASQVKDPTLPQVLATPIMILAMENAALNAIRGHLRPEETAVGILVDVQHLSATPAGQRVTAAAELIKVEGRRLTFSVVAHDEIDEIGRGTHMRSLIDRATFEEQLTKKRARTDRHRSGQ
jgi:fluoroacetyl-CoA thioesterase